jgi:hypothetical protein
MDSAAFLARVEAYSKDGWRLALINVTTVIPTAAPMHGAPAAAAPSAPPAPAAPTGEAKVEVEAPGRFEMIWAFAKDGQFETVGEDLETGDEVPSISDFFGAAFLYENEIRELFGLNITGIGVDLKGQLYKTATKVPFSHAAVKARLAAFAAGQVKS